MNNDETELTNEDMLVYPEDESDELCFGTPIISDKSKKGKNVPGYISGPISILLQHDEDEEKTKGR